MGHIDVGVVLLRVGGLKGETDLTTDTPTPKIQMLGTHGRNQIVQK